MSQNIEEISRQRLELTVHAISTRDLQKLCGGLHASIKEKVAREGLDIAMPFVLENERKLTMLMAELNRRGFNIKDPEFLEWVYSHHNKVNY